MVHQIAAQFNPHLIILFGSYAYGNPGPDSDVDLLVVMDTSLRDIEQAIQIDMALNYDFGLDLIVRTPVTIVHRLVLGDFFLREIILRGRLVYERNHI